MEKSEKINYQYSLFPYWNPIISDNEIDLNHSRDFSILFNIDFNETKDIREQQLERLDFIKEHPKQVNIIANTTRQLISISYMTHRIIEYTRIYNDIIQGDFDRDIIDFFRNDDNSSKIEIILYYLYCKIHDNKREYYFEDVLRKLFDNKVYFYFDKVQKKLLVSFVAIGTELNKQIFNICKYFFADILLDIEVEWRVYPAIINKTNYVIAAEGEQLCGTII